MKATLLLSLLALGVSVSSAQEPLPRAEAVKFAALLNLDLERFQGTPIPTDADVKRPFGMRAEKRGGLVVPEVKLSAQVLAKVGQQVEPIGQLWLAGLAPLREAEPVPRERLNLVTVQRDGQEIVLPLCLLGARRTEAGELELLIYGKGKEPLLTLPLKKMAKPAEDAAGPLVFSAERQGDAVRLKLSVAGAYEATLEVAPPAE
jgi:hypothetical protein